MGVSERIDALEGHLAQLLARQRQGPPAMGAASAATVPPRAEPDRSGRIVRAELQFDDDDAVEAFDERFTAFTEATEVDERSRNWLLS